MGFLSCVGEFGMQVCQSGSSNVSLHTVSLQYFRSLSFPIIFHLQVSGLHTFFVKIQHSYLYFHHLTIFFFFNCKMTMIIS